jgi:hypothetical protein
VVPGTQRKVPISFDDASESDPGPYPIPDDVPIERGGDHHALVIDRDACVLYEMYALIGAPGSWHGGSGAIWYLRTNAARPAGWTSADAAGLPIFPGLVRYTEVEAGEIRRALRFTAARTQAGYVAPALHDASSSTEPSRPPMGLRVRLRRDFDLSGFPASVRVILTALQRYGMILADNGSSWFVSGTSDARWIDDELTTIHRVTGADLEVIQHGPIQR